MLQIYLIQSKMIAGTHSASQCHQMAVNFNNNCDLYSINNAHRQQILLFLWGKESFTYNGVTLERDTQLLNNVQTSSLLQDLLFRDP